MATLKILMAGDVMLGRGIDQVLPQPAPPELHEPVVKSALDYVTLAERRNGRIPRPIPFEYVWGDAIDAFAAADVRIINLETSVTRRGRPEPKGIHYRMAPEHVPVLCAAAIDCCILANNHVLDWGCEGLLDTLDALDAAGIQIAGAGRDAAEAAKPARITASDGRTVLVYALATPTSGVPFGWQAAERRPGIAFLDAPSCKSASAIADRILRERRSEDLVVLSIHWGPNWGFGIRAAESTFARELIHRGAVDVVLGHSSHHPKSIEVTRDRPIFYGAGDLINDYEGIGGYEEFHPDLALLYCASIKDGGAMQSLQLIPFRIENFKLKRPSEDDVAWLLDTMNRECGRFGERVALEKEAFRLDWPKYCT